MSRRTNNLIEMNQTPKKRGREKKDGMHTLQIKRFPRKVHGKNPGRKCQICGKDPYPNYYFCPKCHGHTGSYSDLED